MPLQIKDLLPLRGKACKKQVGVTNLLLVFYLPCQRQPLLALQGKACKYHPCHAKGLCEASRSLALQIEDLLGMGRHGLHALPLRGYMPFGHVRQVSR